MLYKKAKSVSYSAALLLTSGLRWISSESLCPIGPLKVLGPVVGPSVWVKTALKIDSLACSPQPTSIKGFSIRSSSSLTNPPFHPTLIFVLSTRTALRVEAQFVIVSMTSCTLLAWTGPVAPV